jgi:glucoamylase
MTWATMRAVWRGLGKSGLGNVSPDRAAAALQSAGDQMLQAIVFHSDHFELSEQFDATTGYAKSVSNLSWSYASFLSAIRAKNAI